MLTDAAIKALKPKDKLYKIVDRDGMYVVVQPSGSIVFRLDYRLNGRRETLTVEFHRELTRGAQKFSLRIDP
ncbi:Arm DNA-binding domain-containing protein, partial [Novosphingobium clariflavum]